MHSFSALHTNNAQCKPCFIYSFHMFQITVADTQILLVNCDCENKPLMTPYDSFCYHFTSMQDVFLYVVYLLLSYCEFTACWVLIGLLLVHSFGSNALMHQIQFLHCLIGVEQSLSWCRCESQSRSWR